jgi:hypothetical protein
MDVESPEHLERFRDRPEVKAVLLREGPQSGSTEARFERAAKNTLYWPLIDRLDERFRAIGQGEEVREEHELYGRRCWLLATVLSPAPGAAYAIAVAAADGEPAQAMVALLQSVSHDYWFGSEFFK